MLPNADKVVLSTEEICAQTSDFATDRQGPVAGGVDVAEFVHIIAAGYFYGSSDTFRLGTLDAA